MLKLHGIQKEYKTGELLQRALDGVSLSLRDSEFVAVLGPSGSGKTTLLNIIGGLDRYDSGDMEINGVSTKEYKDRDWDTYRNHSIGFVFQSYNLIPHQSVLANVELALTIGGVSRRERRRRAKAALAEVGLAGQEHKRPNQMSGGQMQRVAIARALVNDPDILLADEPTGALDTETSVQVMELLKQVAERRLVVMVTHNPELADAYATRIVKLRDGKIVGDSDPYFPETEEKKAAKKQKKAGMSFLTSLSLSAQNLRTKKARTLLTSFAGSIGIIGIALILALSTGVNQYIADVQKDTMSSYPITISAQTIDLTSLMQQRTSMAGGRPGRTDGEAEEEYTNVRASYRSLETVEAITSSVTENDLTAFKKYLDDPSSEVWQYIGENGIVYTYAVSFEVYTRDAAGELMNTNADPDDIASSGSSSGFGGMMRGMSAMSSVFGGGSRSGADNFTELMAGTDGTGVSRVVTDSYELLFGKWPTAYDEVVLFLSERNMIDAETLYQLGFLSAEEYRAASDAIADGGKAEAASFEYEEILGKTFYLIPACDRYRENADGTFSYVGDGVGGMESLIEDAPELRIVGIVRPIEDAANANVRTAVGYTSALTDYVITHTNDSAPVKAQQSDPEHNVLTGMRFSAPDDETKIEDAKAYVGTLGVSDKATLYSMILYYQSQKLMTEAAEGQSSGGTGSFSGGTGSFSGGTGSFSGGTGSFSGGTGSFSGGTGSFSGGTGSFSGGGAMDESMMASLLDRWLEERPDSEILLSVYDQYVAGATYEDNMASFGKVSYDAPSSISIYTDSFEDKDAIADCIVRYNETVDSQTQITYTDYVALITGSITSIIDVISYVLIAFVAVSLVVSCIMIGIITHISVLERTKEIGILRALGASKRNISQVFNAETVIIGFCSGVLGVTVSALFTIPINVILQSLTGSSSIRAALPLLSAAVLVLISVAITVLGGMIPARKAAKKDPVIALRTE